MRKEFIKIFDNLSRENQENIANRFFREFYGPLEHPNLPSYEQILSNSGGLKVIKNIGKKDKHDEEK